MRATFKTAAAMFAGLAVVAACVAFLAAGASAQSPLVFGIRPSHGDANTPAGSSYFSYTLAPGASVDDTVVISNDGGEQVILRFYAADGITSINGSTAFSDPEETRTGTRSWLSASVADVPVPPGQSVTIAFRVQVPLDAPSGDHVAGWVVEAPPRAGSAGGIGASITERAGVAVVVRVPGETRQQLVLGGVCLNQETGSNYFEVPVRNEGNVLTGATGVLTVTTNDGEEVFSRPADLGNVVPADATFLRLDAPFDPGPGNYVATLDMSLPAGHSVRARSDIAIGEQKVNGCVAAAGQEEEPTRPIPYFGSLPGGGTPWLVVGLLIALLVILAAGREYTIRRRLRSEVSDADRR